MKLRIKRILQLLLIPLGVGCATGARGVEVHINSGDPAFPFPQFLEYTFGRGHSLENLGTKNAEGVVHAELEKDTREAYQIHANEFAYSGEEWQGIKYIWTPYKAAYDCTEGDGYGLLAAAYMADQVTFNGYWMCTHDKRRNRTKKYTDCSESATDYGYGPFALSDGAAPGGNTAADGDVDVALALYVAYKQWGEFMKNEDGDIVTDACGNPISYKQEMINVVRGLVALSTRFPTENPMRVNSGLIGLDGYQKGGDTWVEQTDYAAASNHPVELMQDVKIYDMTQAGDWDNLKTVDVQPGKTVIHPEFAGTTKQHIDYNAPAYFKEFYDFFENMSVADRNKYGITSFEIEQFKRGMASSDWQIGDLIKKSKTSIPTAGWSEISADGSKTSYSSFNEGEDYRCPWRTISNYMWHGAPEYTWDPKTHKANKGSNTYELDAAVKFSKFMNDPAHWNSQGNDTLSASSCMEYGDPHNLPYSGPTTLAWQYEPNTGLSKGDFFILNMTSGMGTFSAVSAQDLELLGLLYRQCAIEWDVNGNSGDDCYLGTKPVYMHGWGRQLGMMVASGNYHAPSQMNPGANMKIYRSIEDSITYCYTGDEIKFLLDYRNYGSVDAEGVKIVENVPEDFVFVEASKGGVYDKGKHTVTWNIGTVPGFRSKTGIDPTKGQVWYKLKAGDQASGRYCTTADITCTNGLGWTTNEYPNYVTATMQRNCVDVVARSLKIEKTVNRKLVNDGNQATFTVKFENSSEAGWIDGGRPRVNVSFANGQDGSRLQLKARLFNDAIEPYINYGNYRISYYVYDAGLNCYEKDGDCPTGWGLSNEIYEGGTSIGSDKGVVVSHENIVEGKDSYGKWNQRMCIQFAPLLVTTTMHLARYFGGANCRIHKGGTSPMRGVWAMFPGNYGNVDWSDDWSWGDYEDEKDGLFYPVTPSWQRLDENGKSIEEPVTKWITCGCNESAKTIKNILVEEYDGYVWRRILGTGPMAGRDVDNVEVRDTLPKGMTFGEFVNECPLEEFGAKWKTEQTADGRDIIIWSIPKMQVKQKGSIVYTATCNFPSGAVCETDDEDIINKAWISGDKNSAIFDTTLITVTCAKVPDPIIPTTLVKTADKEFYQVGDPITYTMEYEQTHGCIVDDATMSPAADWTVKDWSLSSGKLMSGSTQTGTAVFDYTLGTNLYMEYTNLPATYASYQVLLRADKADLSKAIALDIKTMNTSQMEIACYVDGQQVYAPQVVVYGKGNPFTMRLDLTDDVLRIWINKDTTTGPMLSIENMPVRVGYAGFKNGSFTGDNSHGAHQISKLHTHSDYAYNLSIVDRKPAEIGFVSADNGGKLQGDSIVWELQSGKDNPILPGEKFTVSWDGTVDACDQSVTNIAYAKLMGHADNEIMAQVTTKCGESACSLTKVTLGATGKSEDGSKATIDTLAKGSIAVCKADKLVLHAAAKSKGTYLYQWYNGKTKVGKAVKGLDSLEVSEDGSYYVVVSSPDEATCTKNSDTVKVRIDEMPVTALADTSGCQGDTITLKAAQDDEKGYEYAWGEVSTDYTFDVLKDTTVSVAVTNGACVARDTAKVTFGSVTLTGGIFTLNGVKFDRAISDTGSICPDARVKLSVNYESDDDKYEWSSKPKDKLMNVSGPEATIEPKETTTYYVKLRQGCEAVDSFTVTIGAPPLKGGIYTLGGIFSQNNVITGGKEYNRDYVDTGKVCLGVKSLLSVSYKSDDGEYTWSSKPGGVFSNPVGNSIYVEVEDTATFYVEFMQGCLAKDSFTVVIGQPLKVKVDTTVKCGIVELLASCENDDSGLARYTWVKDGEEIKDNPLVLTSTDAPSGTVSVSATSDNGCPSQVIPIGYSNPTPTLKIDGSTTVCPGLEATLAAVYETNVKSDRTVTYKWSDEKGHSLGADDTYLAPAGSYTLSANDGVCSLTEHHKVVEGTGEVKGDLTVNGEKIVGSGADRNYGSCGGPLTIVADYVHDAGTDFLWRVNGTQLGQSGNTVTIEPTEDTQVIIEFTNSCAAVDTFSITMLDSVELAVTNQQKCGETVLSVASSNVKGVAPAYEWTTAAGTSGGKTVTLALDDYAEGKGSVGLVGTAKGYCPGKIPAFDFVIDTLGATISGDEAVCPSSQGELAANVKTNSESTDFTYSWGYRKLGSTAAYTAIEGGSDQVSLPLLSQNSEVSLTVENATCKTTAVFAVNVYDVTPDGKITADGADVAKVGGMKTLTTCGLEPIVLATTHTGENYAWSLDGEDVGSGKTTTINVTTEGVHTQRYVLSYVNKCVIRDTIDVVVKPLSVSADYTLLAGEHCEGEAGSAKLLVDGYNAKDAGSYIKWFKDGQEIATAKNSETLDFGSLKADDSGEYSYEVSNGVCSLPTAAGADAANVTVMPRIKLRADARRIIVPRGEDASIEVSSVPSDAALGWEDAEGDAVGSGNPLAIPAISKDYSLQGVATATGYCNDTIKIEVLADAKAIVKLAADNDVVCFTGTVNLTADTTGTGIVRFPDKYKVGIYVKSTTGDDAAEWTQISNKVEQPVSLSETAVYKAVVTYGTQNAESEEVEVTVYPYSSYNLEYKSRVCTGEPTEVNINNLQPVDAKVVWHDYANLSGDGTSVVITPEETGRYEFEVQQNNGVCTESGVASIATIEPVVLTDADTVICQGSPITLKVQTQGAPVFYKWYDAAGKLLAEKSSVLMHPEENTVYTVVAGNRVCDSAVAKVSVTVSPLPVVDGVEVLETKTVKISASAGEPPYVYGVDAFDYQHDNVITVVNFGVHNFKVKDDIGCVGTLKDTIKAPEIKVPIFITPDGDGTDDIFEVPGLAEAYPDATVKVFDRWGKQLVEYNAADGGWDGTYKGKKMPATDYWYEIYVPELYKYFTGHFTLLR